VRDTGAQLLPSALRCNVFGTVVTPLRLLRWPECAGVTDAGVAGKQNQDDFFIWESEDRQTIM